MPSPRIVLVHGVATTASIWDRVIERLEGFDVLAVERPCSGNLATEVAALVPVAEKAFVVGVSGGATLCLALAASGAQMAGAIAHEPAVGSLVPGLLAPMAEAYAEGGVDVFAATLYGPSWDRTMASADDAAVARELPMFRAFEPSPARAGQGPVLVTVGADSPPLRQVAAQAMRDELGYPVEVLEGCRHFVQWDNADTFANLIRRTVGSLGDIAYSSTA
jgi:pimeloyl-ACP methyl ester carboxylesterase